MFKTLKQKREIKKLEKIILETESKRLRSQSALVSAILDKKEPDEEDLDFFKNYTSTIDQARKKIQEIKDAMQVTA